MRMMVMSGLLALLVSCSSPNGAIDYPELIEIADRYALPAPPVEGKLVLAYTGARPLLGSSSTSHDPGEYRPAFLIEELPGGRARVLMGWEEKIVAPDAEHLPAVREYSLAPPEPKPLGYVLRTASLSGFATAVQLARRGEEDEAKELWDQVGRGDYFDDDDPLEGAVELVARPRLLLARVLYQHFYHATLGDGADLGEIHGQLVRLEKDFPALFSDGDGDDYVPPRRYYAVRRSRFIRDLERTVSAGKAPEGSVEALLVDWGNRTSAHRHLGYFSEHTRECDRPARDVFLRGLKALPELARLTADRRLTRHVRQAEGKAPEERLRLGELAAALLRDMTGSRGPACVPLLQESSEPEADFFAGAAVDVKDGRIASFHDVPVWILGQKHPERLLDLCRQVPSGVTRKAPLFALSRAVLESELPAAEKSAALAGLAERLDGDPRLRAALQLLARVDGPRCAALLRPHLAKLPEDVDEPYWTCETAAWTHVVMWLEDDEVWKEYLRIARNASVGLRMEMMRPMNYTYIGERNRERRLGFLAAFLDDPTVRDASVDAKKYDGPCAAFHIEKIEVRDFVAMEISYILGLGDRPTEFWTPADWSALRARVKTALEKEKLPRWESL